MNIESIGAKLTSEQYAIIEDLAGQQGMTVGQYLRDVILRQHVEGHGTKWPEGYFDKGAAVTTHGGKGRGGGRKPKKAAP